MGRGDDASEEEMPWMELTSLPGIGEKKAARIREQGIRNIRELAAADLRLACACTGNSRKRDATKTFLRWQDAARARLLWDDDDDDNVNDEILSFLGATFG
ncbi:hypothetical protein CTAYLR_004548 [Chrysophaeum taylorii]|uniref:Uncharacterized protein n=1 Tax=Chrysophaeum taylorii TaxID=2483200 RepID=A0AAD7UMX5_9STRA|nr:hypothetical protein CTAYLR_004548 [Chrysophaeum taylorii]